MGSFERRTRRVRVSKPDGLWPNRQRSGLNEPGKYTPIETVQVLETLEHNGHQKPQQAAS
jgi:hypothetical protein